MDAVHFITTHWDIIVTVLFLLSELIGAIPSVKANTVFGFMRNLLLGEVKKVNTLTDQKLSKEIEK